MEYTWKITGVKTLDVNGVENAVVQTYWEKIGTDSNGIEAKFTGATPFTHASIDPDKFVPFTDLTEELMLDWIKNVVVGSYEEHVNDQIQKQIDLKSIKQPSLPWVSEEIVEPIIEAPLEAPTQTL